MYITREIIRFIFINYKVFWSYAKGRLLAQHLKITESKREKNQRFEKQAGGANGTITSVLSQAGVENKDLEGLIELNQTAEILRAKFVTLIQQQLIRSPAVECDHNTHNTRIALRWFVRRHSNSSHARGVERERERDTVRTDGFCLFESRSSCVAFALLQ